METRTIVLNLQPRTTIQAVNVSQYDVGVPLRFIIYDGSGPANLSSVTSCKIQMTRPSGMAVTETCQMSGNVVTKNTTLDMTREAGDIEAELRFASGTTNVGTCNFTLAVEPAAQADDAIEADTEALREIAQEIHADVAQNTQSATIASQSASDAQEYASSAQHNAEVATAAATSAGAASSRAVEAARQAALNAQTASQSAQDVVDGVEAAQAAATVATNKAAEATTAATTATSAATTATSAKDTAVSARDAAQTAQTAALTARDAAVSASTTAQQAGSDAEAWAVGQRGGTDVPSSDETYQNNAKYYAMQGGGANLAEDFSTSTAYAVGDYVRYNAKIYEFTSAHSAGAWNSSHVTEVKVMDEVSALKDDLNQISEVVGSGTFETYDYVPIALDIASRTGTQAGITFTQNADGSIYVNGTNTSNDENVYSIKNASGPALVSLVAGKKYLLSGCPSGGSVSTCRLILKPDGKTNIVCSDTGNGAIADITESGDYRVCIIVDPGATVDNTFRPVIKEQIVIHKTGYILSAKDTVARERIVDLSENIANISLGLSEYAKDALLECLRNVAWINKEGETYYNNLVMALNYEIVSFIETEFEQNNTIISETDVLDDLKPLLTVRGTLPNGSQLIIPNDMYTLSGTLASGTATITVAYKNKTATFSVNVSTVPSGYTLKNYVVANGTQYILTDIPETDAEDWWFRLKENRSGYEDRKGHVFSSANFSVPYLQAFGQQSNDRVNSFRFGTQVVSADMVFGIWQTDTDYVVESFKGSDNVYVNDSFAGRVSKGSTMDSGNTFALLGYKGADGVVAEKYRFVGKLYYCKVFDSNNKKAHDFVPCLNPSNVVGLYDLVDGVFYPPAIGTLVAG